MTYFKPSGKYSCEGEFEVSRTCPVFEINSMVREMNAKRTLPGLASGNWQGFVHVDASEHPYGYPHLLIL